MSFSFRFPFGHRLQMIIDLGPVSSSWWKWSCARLSCAFGEGEGEGTAPGERAAGGWYSGEVSLVDFHAYVFGGETLPGWKCLILTDDFNCVSIDWWVTPMVLILIAIISWLICLLSIFIIVVYIYRYIIWYWYWYYIIIEFIFILLSQPYQCNLI